MNKKREKLLDEMITIYIREGKPLGSESLRLELSSADFQISSATIRNYFKVLVSEGVLSQPHISSGRVPTHNALKNYWRKNIDISVPLEISSLQNVANASEKYEIYCGIRLWQSEFLSEVINFRDKYIILLFGDSGNDSGANRAHFGTKPFDTKSFNAKVAQKDESTTEAILPHSSHLYNFLQEMLYQNIEEIRFMARSVCANVLFYSLENRANLANKASNFGCKFLEIGDSVLFMEILNSHIFYRLKNGFHFLKDGYLGLIQDVRFDENFGKMFVFGRLDCDYAGFYDEIAS